METLYKVTQPDGTPPWAYDAGKWSLPRQDRLGRWRPGAWWRVGEDLVACQRGLHLTTEADLPRWVDKWRPFAIWEAQVEPGAVTLPADGKLVVSAARLRRLVLMVDQAWLDAYTLREPPTPMGVRRVGMPDVGKWSLQDMLAFDTDQPPPAPEPLTFGVHYMEDRYARQAPYAQSCTRARMWSRTKRRMERLLGPMPVEQRAWVLGVPTSG